MVNVIKLSRMMLLPVFEGDGLHKLGCEKLSEKIISPKPGMVSIVGLDTKVGNGVRVAVAGNQLMVRVAVGVGCSIVGVRVASGFNPEQAASIRLTASKRYILCDEWIEII